MPAISKKEFLEDVISGLQSKGDIFTSVDVQTVIIQTLQYYDLQKIEKISGVANIHPHRFRRTLATSLIKHGMPIQEVARILGHDKIDTTM